MDPWWENISVQINKNDIHFSSLPTSALVLPKDNFKRRIISGFSNYYRWQGISLAKARYRAWSMKEKVISQNQTLEMTRMFYRSYIVGYIVRYVQILVASQGQPTWHFPPTTGTVSQGTIAFKYIVHLCLIQCIFYTYCSRKSVA